MPSANSIRKAEKRQRRACEYMAGVIGPQGQPPVPAGDDDEYEVAAIVDIRLSPDQLAGAMNTGAVQFRVRWKGFGAAGDTWESVAGLNAAKRVVDAFKVERFIDLFEKCEWEQKQVLSLEDKNDKLLDKVELMQNIHEEDEVLLTEMVSLAGSGPFL
jgi:hypothetical protein